MTATQIQFLLIVISAVVLLLGLVVLFAKTLAYLKFGACSGISGAIVVITREGIPVDMILPPDGDEYVNPPKGRVGHDPNSPTWEIIPQGQHYVDTRSWLNKLLGVYFFIPFIEQVHTYWFSWSELTQPAGTELEYVMVSRVEKVDRILRKQFAYAEIAKQLSTQERTPVNVRYTITVQVNNPWMALFGTDDWLEQLKSLTEEALKDYVGEQTFDELKSQADALGDLSFYVEKVKPLNTQMTGEKPGIGTMRKFGVTITRVNIKSVVDSDDADGEVRKARTELYIAQQKAEAEKAKGFAQAAVTRAQGEAVAANADALLKAQTSSRERVEIALRSSTFANAEVVSLGSNEARLLLNGRERDGRRNDREDRPDRD